MDPYVSDIYWNYTTIEGNVLFVFSLAQFSKKKWARLPRLKIFYSDILVYFNKYLGKGAFNNKDVNSFQKGVALTPNLTFL